MRAYEGCGRWNIHMYTPWLAEEGAGGSLVDTPLGVAVVLVLAREVVQMLEWCLPLQLLHRADD